MSITINFWFLIADSIGEVRPEQVQEDNDDIDVLFSPPPAHHIESVYLTGEDLGEFTALREELQALEDEYPGDFIVAGCWDFHTGEPIGGVGSPWFLTPPELIDYMPNGVLAQRHFNAGQAARKFV